MHNMHGLDSRTQTGHERISLSLSLTNYARPDSRPPVFQGMFLLPILGTIAWQIVTDDNKVTIRPMISVCNVMKLNILFSKSLI